MIGGKKLKTLREAKEYQESVKTETGRYVAIYLLPMGRVNKYFVGTSMQWLNL